MHLSTRLRVTGTQGSAGSGHGRHPATHPSSASSPPAHLSRDHTYRYKLHLSSLPRMAYLLYSVMSCDTALPTEYLDAGLLFVVFKTSSELGFKSSRPSPGPLQPPPLPVTTVGVTYSLVHQGDANCPCTVVGACGRTGPLRPPAPGRGAVIAAVIKVYFRMLSNSD